MIPHLIERPVEQVEDMVAEETLLLRRLGGTRFPEPVLDEEDDQLRARKRSVCNGGRRVRREEE